MKIIFKALLIAALLVSSHAVQLRKNGVSTEEKLEQLAEKSSFVKNLVNTVLLSLASGGQVEEVLAFLDQAISDTQTDYNNLSAESETENQRLSNLISGLNSDISNMNDDLSSTILNIQALSVDIDTLDTQIANIQTELAALDDREARIRTAYDNDNTAFATRQQRDNAAIAALQTIIPELNDLAAQASSGAVLLERPVDKIKEELKKIPNGKALAALVQVSTGFNAPKLALVVEKLSGIVVSLQASKAADEANQANSVIRFNGLISQLEELRNFKSQALITARGQRNAKDSEKTLAIAKRDQLSQDIASTTDLKVSTVETLTVTMNAFNRRLAEARLAISGLQEAKQIIVDGAENLRSRESYTNSRLASNFF